MNILWIIVVIILAASVLSGRKKGCVRTLLELLAKVVVITIVIMIVPFITSFIMEKKIMNQPEFVVRAASFVVAFFILFAIAQAIIGAFDVLAKLPLVKGVNRFLGLFAGFFEGIVSVWIFFTIVAAISKTALGFFFLMMIEESPFLNYIYEHNLILQILSDFGVL